jgi:hypothetical protein
MVRRLVRFFLSVNEFDADLFINNAVNMESEALWAINPFKKAHFRLS